MSLLWKLKQALAKAVPSSWIIQGPPSGMQYGRVCTHRAAGGILEKMLQQHKIAPRESFNVILAIKYRDVEG